VVVCAIPLKLTTAPFTKFVPLTVSVRLVPPAAVLAGERVVIIGKATAETTRLTAFEVPPPGAGVFTVMGKFPTAAISVTRICAVSCVALTNAVVRAVPLNRTTELLLKFVPLTVNVKAGLPAALLGGDNMVSVGTGLFTAKLSAGVDVPPPGVGFVTLTMIVPVVTISEAAIEAVSCPELTMVVA
jgi:hypothetical protein